MTTRARMVPVLAGLLLVLLGITPVAQAAPPSLTDCSTELYHDDRRLGPEKLPLLGPVGSQLYGYSRTGYRPVETFLERYYDDAANSWRYPPNDGYVLGPDGQPLKWTHTLAVGVEIDRYGSEFGGFLAPRGAAYTTRAIPPSNLVGTPAAGCNYHVYEVLAPFDVQSGPIAAWFFQRGGGLQYQLDGALVPGAPGQLNVKWLLENGYLERVI